MSKEDRQHLIQYWSAPDENTPALKNGDPRPDYTDFLLKEINKSGEVLTRAEFEADFKLIFDRDKKISQEDLYNTKSFAHIGRVIYRMSKGENPPIHWTNKDISKWAYTYKRWFDNNLGSTGRIGWKLMSDDTPPGQLLAFRFLTDSFDNSSWTWIGFAKSFGIAALDPINYIGFGASAAIRKVGMKTAGNKGIKWLLGEGINKSIQGAVKAELKKQLVKDASGKMLKSTLTKEVRRQLVKKAARKNVIDRALHAGRLSAIEGTFTGSYYESVAQRFDIKTDRLDGADWGRAAYSVGLNAAFSFAFGSGASLGGDFLVRPAGRWIKGKWNGKGPKGTAPKPPSPQTQRLLDRAADMEMKGIFLKNIADKYTGKGLSPDDLKIKLNEEIANLGSSKAEKSLKAHLNDIIKAINGVPTGMDPDDVVSGALARLQNRAKILADKAADYHRKAQGETPVDPVLFKKAQDNLAQATEDAAIAKKLQDIFEKYKGNNFSGSQVKKRLETEITQLSSSTDKIDEAVVTKLQSIIAKEIDGAPSSKAASDTGGDALDAVKNEANTFKQQSDDFRSSAQDLLRTLAGDNAARTGKITAKPTRTWLHTLFRVHPLANIKRLGSAARADLKIPDILFSRHFMMPIIKEMDDSIQTGNLMNKVNDLSGALNDISERLSKSNISAEEARKLSVQALKKFSQDNLSSLHAYSRNLDGIIKDIDFQEKLINLESKLAGKLTVDNAINEIRGQVDDPESYRAIFQNMKKHGPGYYARMTAPQIDGLKRRLNNMKATALSMCDTEGTFIQKYADHIDELIQQKANGKDICDAINSSYSHFTQLSEYASGAAMRRKSWDSYVNGATLQEKASVWGEAIATDFLNTRNGMHDPFEEVDKLFREMRVGYFNPARRTAEIAANIFDPKKPHNAENHFLELINIVNRRKTDPKTGKIDWQPDDPGEFAKHIIRLYEVGQEQDVTLAIHILAGKLGKGSKNVMPGGVWKLVEEQAPKKAGENWDKAITHWKNVDANMPHSPEELDQRDMMKIIWDSPLKEIIPGIMYPGKKVMATPFAKKWARDPGKYVKNYLWAYPLGFRFTDKVDESTGQTVSYWKWDWKFQKHEGENLAWHQTGKWRYLNPKNHPSWLKVILLWRPATLLANPAAKLTPFLFRQLKNPWIHTPVTIPLVAVPGLMYGIGNGLEMGFDDEYKLDDWGAQGLEFTAKAADTVLLAPWRFSAKTFEFGYNQTYGRLFDRKMRMKNWWFDPSTQSLPLDRMSEILDDTPTDVLRLGEKTDENGQVPEAKINSSIKNVEKGLKSDKNRDRVRALRRAHLLDSKINELTAAGKIDAATSQKAKASLQKVLKAANVTSVQVSDAPNTPPGTDSPDTDKKEQKKEPKKKAAEKAAQKAEKEKNRTLKRLEGLKKRLEKDGKDIARERLSDDLKDKTPAEMAALVQAQIDGINDGSITPKQAMENIGTINNAMDKKYIAIVQALESKKNMLANLTPEQFKLYHSKLPEQFKDVTQEQLIAQMQTNLDNLRAGKMTAKDARKAVSTLNRKLETYHAPFMSRTVETASDGVDEFLRMTHVDNGSRVSEVINSSVKLGVEGAGNVVDWVGNTFNKMSAPDNKEGHEWLGLLGGVGSAWVGVIMLNKWLKIDDWPIPFVGPLVKLALFVGIFLAARKGVHSWIGQGDGEHVAQDITGGDSKPAAENKKRHRGGGEGGSNIISRDELEEGGLFDTFDDEDEGDEGTTDGSGSTGQNTSSRAKYKHNMDSILEMKAEDFDNISLEEIEAINEEIMSYEPWQSHDGAVPQTYLRTYKDGSISQVSMNDMDQHEHVAGQRGCGTTCYADFNAMVSSNGHLPADQVTLNVDEMSEHNDPEAQVTAVVVQFDQRRTQKTELTLDNSLDLNAPAA